MAHDRITAIVKEHKIELPLDVDWPDGMIVRIEPVEEKIPTLWEVLKDFDGIVTDMPSDLAENHDHYIRGLPKKT